MGLLGLVLPSRCAVCAAPGPSLCERCFDGLIRIAPPVCERCGCPGAWPVRRCVECAGRRLAFARARSAVVYDARARPLVSAWKERGRRDLAPVLAEIVAEVIAPLHVDAITFVPGDRERGRERGHVPAARLAAALASLWRLPLEPLLARTGAAPRQASLPRGQRGANVRGAFRVLAPPPAGTGVLVDDRRLSGWTIAMVGGQLRRAGAGAVVPLVLATLA